MARPDEFQSERAKISWVLSFSKGRDVNNWCQDQLSGKVNGRDDSEGSQGIHQNRNMDIRRRQPEDPSEQNHRYKKEVTRGSIRIEPWISEGGDYQVA